MPIFMLSRLRKHELPSQYLRIFCNQAPKHTPILLLTTPHVKQGLFPIFIFETCHRKLSRSTSIPQLLMLRFLLLVFNLTWSRHWSFWCLIYLPISSGKSQRNKIGPSLLALFQMLGMLIRAAQFHDFFLKSGYQNLYHNNKRLHMPWSLYLPFSHSSH